MNNAILISPSIDAVIRAVLQLASGWLVTSGQLDPTQATTLGGAVLALLTIAWSLWHKQTVVPIAPPK